MSDHDNLGTWIGVSVSMLGLVLIAFSWGRVAAETNVGLQMPYVISAGVTGLGLVLIGVAAASITTRRRDASRRSEQMQQLAATLEAIRTELEERA